MRETKEMLEKILTGKEGKVNEKELIKEYQERLSPNILAYFYSNNYGLLCKINKLYPIINEEDKASFCLQELDKCLQNFDINRNLKFITYFSKCYKNRLRTETETLLTKKRKINLNCIDFDNLLDMSIIDNLDNIDIILDNYNLTNEEKKQCKLLDYGYSLTEISKILKVSISTISYRNNKIKQKILASI